MHPVLPDHSAGVFRHPANEPAAAIFTVDLQNFHAMRDILRPLGEALDFPEWYGANLDALFDCLSDPEWLESGGVVRLLGLSPLHEDDPEGWKALLDVFQSACATRHEEGSPALTLLLDVNDPALPAWTPA